jgi:hypothetical protein
MSAAACSLVTSFDDLTGGTASDAASTDASGEASSNVNGDASSDGPAMPSKDASIDAPSGCPADTAGLPGLLAYVPFDDGSGNKAVDCSGNGHDLAVIGTDTSWTTGKHGGALAFGGKSGCAEIPAPVPDALAFDGTMAFTVGLWVRMDQFSPAWPRAFLVGQTGDPTQSGWRMGAESSTQSYTFSFASPDGGTAFNSGTNTIKLGAWHHVAVVFSAGATNAFIVLDGVVKKQVAAAPFVKDVLAFRVGCSSDDQNYLVGAVDELRVYDHALSMPQLAQIAQ